MTIEVRRIDPDDESAVRDWWTVTNEAHSERALNPMRPFPVWLAKLSTPDPDESVDAFGAFDAGELVGTSVVWLPLSDNTHLAYTELTVPPARRRRGAGSALLGHFEEYADAAGRRTFMTEVPTRDGDDNAGTRFAGAHGYSVANRDEIKVLSLGESEPTWGRLDDEVAARIGEHRVESWWGPTPEQHVEGYCALVSRFLSLIPLGELDLEDMNFTPERLRRKEEQARAKGQQTVTAIALTPDGTPCGTSDLNLALSDPSRAFIGITMVLPEHRGHALGAALKLTTHRALIERHPECALVVTGNAAVNTHMNAINERMGYRVLETVLEMQKKR